MLAVLPSCTEELWPDFYLGGPKVLGTCFAWCAKQEPTCVLDLPVNHRFFCLLVVQNKSYKSDQCFGGLSIKIGFRTFK